MTRENRVNVGKQRDCLLAWGQKRNKKHVVIQMNGVSTEALQRPKKGSYSYEQWPFWTGKKFAKKKNC